MSDPKRRLSLSRRQIMLAEIARRNAMIALAGTIGEETKAARLLNRSRELAREYRSRTGSVDGQSLSDLARFAGALERLASDAECSLDDAGRQAASQREELSRHEDRIHRLNERAVEARADLHNRAARRNEETPVARKLQKARSLLARRS